MIGVGGSDSLSQAESFASTHGGPPNMLWSESSTAWRHYRSRNPQLVLLDGAGVKELARVDGFNERRLQDALDAATTS